MKIFGIDCEMVGVYPNNTDSLARVSLVDDKGKLIYDKYVRQNKRVYCYRTPITGIVREDLLNAKKYRNARREVIKIIENSILVGHDIHHDLNILQITPELLYDINCQVRDTAMYGFFRQTYPNDKPSLKLLALTHLNMDIQKTIHNSVEDAHAAVMLYTKVKNIWEREIQWHRDWNLCYEDDDEDDDDDYEDDDYEDDNYEDDSDVYYVYDDDEGENDEYDDDNDYRAW